MKYLTTTKVAEKWNISDRRVRVLCKEGRIPGVKEENGSYMIPFDAVKPKDKRFRTQPSYTYTEVEQIHIREEIDAYMSVKPILYMKWQDEIIAQVDNGYNVFFTKPDYNSVISNITGGQNIWARERFESFLRDRIVSRDRKDIEKILYRCGLFSYDTIRVGIATKAISASDMLWITDNPDEKFNEAVTDVFDSVFLQRIDAEGDSVDTPEGFNIKRYGVYKGKYGIYKKRISPVTTDAESELAVYRLAELMAIPCCKVYRVDEDTIFSQFEYDFSNEYIVHMRRLFEAREHIGFTRGDNEYFNLLAIRPQYQVDFIKMIALDFVTRQDDRHLSNIAIKINKDGESFYPLYDNGRSLFYEDNENTATRACRDIERFATSFGASGTYYDYIIDIAKSGVDFSKIMNLEISQKDIKKILIDSGFKGYRLDASMIWLNKTLEVLMGNIK